MLTTETINIDTIFGMITRKIGLTIEDMDIATVGQSLLKTREKQASSGLIIQGDSLDCKNLAV